MDGRVHGRRDVPKQLERAGRAQRLEVRLELAVVGLVHRSFGFLSGSVSGDIHDDLRGFAVEQQLEKLVDEMFRVVHQMAASVSATSTALGRAGVSKAFARKGKFVVAMSGKRDYVSDGERVFGVDNGHKWLTTLTGTGCMSTTMIAAFAAVEQDALLAAVGGYAAFGLAAEMAAAHAEGPASFKVAFFDHLYHLSPEQLAAGARVVDISDGEA